MKKRLLNSSGAPRLNWESTPGWVTRIAKHDQRNEPVEWHNADDALQEKMLRLRGAYHGHDKAADDKKYVDTKGAEGAAPEEAELCVKYNYEKRSDGTQDLYVVDLLFRHLIS